MGWVFALRNKRKRLDDVKYHDLEFISLFLGSFATFSLCFCLSLRMDALTKSRFVLNCFQICTLVNCFACLKAIFSVLCVT